MYVVLVTFRIASGQEDAFEVRVLAQARESLGRESGCRQFDVARSESGGAEFLLYEVYTDRTAFDRHLASDHFRRFDAEVAASVAHKAVTTWIRR